jgi:hypothetical protein
MSGDKKDTVDAPGQKRDELKPTTPRPAPGSKPVLVPKPDKGKGK